MRQPLLLASAIVSLMPLAAFAAGSQPRLAADEETSATLPYTINFKQSCEGWTAADNNGDSYTWNTDFLDYSGVYMEGMYAPHDDDYVSPKFTLVKGRTYTINTGIEQMMLMTGDVLSLVAGTDKTAMTEVKKLSVANFGPNEDVVEFVPESDGDYYFAFRHTLPDVAYGATLSLCTFSIAEPELAVALPYEINFKQGYEGWSSADNNGDGYTWKTDIADYGIYMEGNAAPHNDDFISPKFALAKGKTYDIETLLEVVLPCGTDVVALVGGTDLSAMTEIAQLSVNNFGPNADKFEFTPETDGEYYFAFRNTSPSALYLPTQYLSACAFSIAEQVEEQEGDLVSTDFSGENPLKGWTVLDSNNDNTTWDIIEGLAGVVYNSDTAIGAAEDWLISPRMQMIAGQDYLVNYTLSQTSAFGEDVVEIRFGAEATAGGMSALLATERLEFENGNGSASRSARISCMTDGMYRVGFRIITGEPNGTLALTAVEVLPVEKAIPMPVSGLTAISDMSAGKVTLTWTNPVADTFGAGIAAVDVLIYENGSFIEMLAERNAGAEDSYTYSPADFSGDKTYTVRAAIDGIESEDVSATICLDDIEGTLVPVKEMPITSETSPEWVLLDNGGKGKWVYDSFHCFYFKHPNGAATAEDDWAISPAVELQTGKRYVVVYQLATNLGGGATFDVTVGDAQTSEAQTRVLESQDNLLQNGIGVFQTRQFTVEAAGPYHIGFHATDVKHSITLSRVSVYYVERKQSGVEDAVSGTAITYDCESSSLLITGAFAALTVYDAGGRAVVAAGSGDSSVIDLSGLEKGLYIVRITDKQGVCTGMKFVK